MRKTLNINLGGMAFIIDENAFEVLHTYLETLKTKFNNEAERAEIMNDIEARIGELLGQRLQNRREVIGLEDVQFVTAAMGRPEDIAGDESEVAGSTGTQSSSSATSSSASSAPVKKRLFRDPDDAKVSGVISGICHYFGIEDPTWMRIAAVILIPFTSGAIIPLYLLLLVIIPKAQTAAEKLQMKGEPININTIEKEIKEAAGKAGESVQKFVKEQNIFERLWDALVAVMGVCVKIIAVSVIAFSMLFLIIVVACFFAFFVLGSTPYNAASHMLVDSNSALRFFSFGFLLFLALPTIALIYLALKALLGQRSRVSWLKWVLLGGWVTGLVFLLISSGQVIGNFSLQRSKKVDISLKQPERGTLYVQLTDTTGKKLSRNWEDNEDENFNLNIHGSGLFINGTDFNEIGRIPIGKPSLEIMASENDSFYLQEIVTAHGRDNNDATNNAGMVVYSFTQADSVVSLWHTLYIDKTSKWRLQSMRLRIAIPKGKQIRFADNIDLWACTVKGDMNYDDTYFDNTVWTVEDGKVKCITGENHKNAEAEAAKEANKHADKPDKLDKKDYHTDKDEDKDDKDDEDF